MKTADKQMTIEEKVHLMKKHIDDIHYNEANMPGLFTIERSYDREQFRVMKLFQRKDDWEHYIAFFGFWLTGPERRKFASVPVKDFYILPAF